jgi:uncharacterized protein involved in exopolysaccharide biosynthesis
MQTAERPVEIFEPPGIEPPTRSTLGAAIARYWIVVLAIGLVGAGAGSFMALERDPVYTANVRLAVGPVDVTSPGLPGLVTASQSLAGLYSRTIAAQPIVERVARRADLQPQQVTSRVSASPVPESPVFVVRATGPSERQAVEVANLAADALGRYTRQLNRQRARPGRLLRRYRDAARELDALGARRERARAALADADTASARAHLSDASAAFDAANLRKQTVGVAYRQASQQGLAASSLVQVLTPALEATSDRRRTVELWGLAGLAAGLALGGVLALALAARRARG